MNIAANSWKTTARFFGVILLFFATISFLLTGYRAFAQFWILHHWTKVDATVLSGELRQQSLASARTTVSAGTSTPSYYVHCTVSYRAQGRDWQSSLDSPPSPYRLDGQVWAGHLSPGQSVAIQYYTANPARVRLADNPAEVTPAASLRSSCYLFIPGILLVLLSRKKFDA